MPYVKVNGKLKYRDPNKPLKPDETPAVIPTSKPVTTTFMGETRQDIKDPKTGVNKSAFSDQEIKNKMDIQKGVENLKLQEQIKATANIDKTAALKDLSQQQFQEIQNLRDKYLTANTPEAKAAIEAQAQNAGLLDVLLGSPEQKAQVLAGNMINDRGRFDLGGTVNLLSRLHNQIDIVGAGAGVTGAGGAAAAGALGAGGSAAGTAGAIGGVGTVTGLSFNKIKNLVMKGKQKELMGDFQNDGANSRLIARSVSSGFDPNLAILQLDQKIASMESRVPEIMNAFGADPENRLANIDVMDDIYKELEYITLVRQTVDRYRTTKDLNSYLLELGNLENEQQF